MASPAKPAILETPKSAPTIKWFKLLRSGHQENHPVTGIAMNYDPGDVFPSHSDLDLRFNHGGDSVKFERLSSPPANAEALLKGDFLTPSWEPGLASNPQGGIDQPPPQGNAKGLETLKMMSFADLKKWASGENIDIAKCKSKEEALELISKAV